MVIHQNPTQNNELDDRAHDIDQGSILGKNCTWLDN